MTKRPDGDDEQRPLRGRGPAAMLNNIFFLLVLIAIVIAIVFVFATR